jgi:hypothetical protein
MGDFYPHRLWHDGKHFAWLTDEQADAFPTAEEKLPGGIRAGYLLEPGWLVPEGWEQRFSDGWTSTYNPTPTPVEARRITAPPAPKTERVPWWEAFGFGMTVIADDGSHVRPNNVLVSDDGQVTLHDGGNVAGGLVTPDSDDTIEVLVEGD